MMKNRDRIVTSYAETLLRVFNIRVGASALALKFNRDDMFEVLSGKSMSKLSQTYFDKQAPKEAEEDSQDRFRLAFQFLEDVKKAKDAYQFMVAFMESVSDALTATDLCEKYNRELAIFEVEGAEWMAVDLRTIASVDADF